MNFLKKNSTYCSSVLVSFLILLLRASERVTKPDLWAEDGYWFVNHSLSIGWPSIFTQMAGYFQIAERASVWLLIQAIPLPYLPHAIALTCLLIFSLIISKITSKDYEWLIPSQVLRYCLLLTFCFLPGLHEILANFCNLPWLFFYYLGLIALKDPKESLSKMEIGFSCLALFSTGTAILLIPVFMYRCYLRKKQPCLSRDLFLLLLICGTVLSTIFLLPREWQLYQRRDYYAYGSAYIRSLAQSGFIQPWLGDQITFFLMKDEIEFYSIGLILLASFGLLVQAFRGKSSQAQTVLFLLFASVSSFPVLTGMTRPNVLFAWTEPPTAWFFKHRYAFPLAFIAVSFLGGFFLSKEECARKKLSFCLDGRQHFLWNQTVQSSPLRSREKMGSNCGTAAKLDKAFRSFLCFGSSLPRRMGRFRLYRR